MFNQDPVLTATHTESNDGKICASNSDRMSELLMRRDVFEYRQRIESNEAIKSIDRKTRAGRARARELKRSFEFRNYDMCSMELDQIDTNKQVHST